MKKWLKLKKRNGLWQLRVRSRNVGSKFKYFHNKADAVAWAKVQGAMIWIGECKPKDKRYSTSGDLIQTSLKKVSSLQHNRKADDLWANFEINK